MDEKFKQRVIEIFMSRKISLSYLYKIISSEFDMSRKEFYLNIEKLMKSKEIIRRPSRYNIRCKCCNNYVPNRQIIGIYCERCTFLGLYKNKLIEKTNEKENEYDEY